MMFIEDILTFLFSLFFIYIIKYYAGRFGLIDIPNERSTHSKNTARGAGIGFFLAGALIFPFFYSGWMNEYKWVFLAIGTVFFIGVWDDIKEISFRLKFIILILSTMMLFFDNIIIDDVGTFFGVHIILGWFAIPFTIFAVVGFTNALNLIDGLDGLSASISIIILGGLFTIGYMHDDIFIMAVSSTFVSSLLAFLFFNWYPASIFMGDSGSLPLGFIIALLSTKALAYIPTVSVLFLGALPIIDTVVAMIRRKKQGKSLFAADHCHIHHVIKYFFEEKTKKTVITLSLLQFIYTVVAIQMNKGVDQGFLLVLFILNIILVYMFLMAMLRRQNRQC